MYKLSIFKDEFEPILADYLDEKVREASFINRAAANLLYETKKVISNNGKRFRPALAYYSFIAANGDAEHDKNIFKLGVALEIFHSYGFIHDDILDRALVRRGDPTLESAYRDIFKRFISNRERVNQLALNAAISGGDFAHLIADQIFSSIDCDDDTRKKITDLYYQMQFEVHAGQADDSYGVGIKDLSEVDEKQVFRMIDFKSGRYSIQKPMLLGATLAGLEEEKVKILEIVGQELGLVFQIKDDILGLFGDEKEIGKSNVSDIKEGKRTVLMIRTYEAATDEERQRMQEILGNPEITEEDVQWIKDLVIQYNILSEIESFCEKVVDKSKKKITDIFDITNPGASFIFELTDFIWQRKK